MILQIWFKRYKKKSRDDTEVIDMLNTMEKESIQINIVKQIDNIRYLGATTYETEKLDRNSKYLQWQQ